MEKVIITKPMVGIYSMQVCVEPDATDEEILEVCNRDNLAGTTGGWQKVKRETSVQCEKSPNRIHFLVDC